MPWEGSDRREANPMLCEIHAMLKVHVQRFEDHVKLDDQREVEQKGERKEIASRMLDVERSQGKAIWSLGIILVLTQVALKWWK